MNALYPRLGRKRSDSLEQDLAVGKRRDTKIFEIVVGQVRQQLTRDPVSTKASVSTPRLSESSQSTTSVSTNATLDRAGLVLRPVDHGAIVKAGLFVAEQFMGDKPV